MYHGGIWGEYHTSWRLRLWKEGVGRNSSSSSPTPSSSMAPSYSVSASCSSSCSRHSWSFHSDVSLLVSPSGSGGTRLPTSVVERKSSTAYPHLPSASRSLTVYLLFHRLVSFITSTHRIFCCIFHSGYTLKRLSLVCKGH